MFLGMNATPANIKHLSGPEKLPGARFSKVPIINGSVKLLLFTCKIEVSVGFISNMIKLSVSKIKWSSLLARTRALILYITI